MHINLVNKNFKEGKINLHGKVKYLCMSDFKGFVDRVEDGFIGQVHSDVIDKIWFLVSWQTQHNINMVKHIIMRDVNERTLND